jgi:uncharacterized membrane protein YhaH (DUF805 family)
MQMNTFAWFFLSLRGRVSRQEFWLGYFGLVVVALLLVHALPHADGAIYFLPGDTPDNEAWRSELLGWPEFISLVLTWPFIAIYAKRLHDLGLSAWWLLLIPVVTFVAGMCELSRLHIVAYCVLLFFSAFCRAAPAPIASARIRSAAQAPCRPAIPERASAKAAYRA